MHLQSHIRFADHVEPETDDDVRLIAEVFAKPFAELLRIRSDASSATPLIITARRTASGFVEIAFFFTYFGAQAAASAPRLFQAILPIMEEFAKLQWISAGQTVARPVVDSENAFLIFDRTIPPGGGDAKSTDANSSDVTAQTQRPKQLLTPQQRRWARTATAIAVVALVLVLAAGNYWFAFGRADPHEAQIEELEGRIEELEREAAAPQSAPPVTQTVTVGYPPPPVVVRPSPERRRRWSSSGD